GYRWGVRFRHAASEIGRGIPRRLWKSARLGRTVDGRHRFRRHRPDEENLRRARRRRTVVQTALTMTRMSIPVINPARTSETVGEIEMLSESEVDAAIAKAHTAFGAWAAAKPEDRSDRLK